MQAIVPVPRLALHPIEIRNACPPHVPACSYWIHLGIWVGQPGGIRLGLSTCRRLCPVSMLITLSSHDFTVMSGLLIVLVMDHCDCGPQHVEASVENVTDWARTSTLGRDASGRLSSLPGIYLVTASHCSGGWQRWGHWKRKMAHET